MRWLMAVILIFVIFGIGQVNAATCSFNAPASNANITSSPYTLNITCLPSSSDGSIYNVTFRYSTDGSSYKL